MLFVGNGFFPQIEPKNKPPKRSLYKIFTILTDLRPAPLPFNLESSKM